MSILANPTQKSPERAFALQKYLLLHFQHDALQRHLKSIASASEAPSTSPSSLSSSPSSTSNFPTGPASSPANCHTTRCHRSSSVSYRSPTVAPISEFPTTETSDSDDAGSRPGLLKRRSSLPLTLTAVASQSEIEEEEMKLMDVNQQIKATLTELLNCESVRVDRRYRMWVQGRLMDVERELRGERSASLSRRRCSIDENSIHS